MDKSRENQISPIPHGLQPGQARPDHPVLAPEIRNKGGRPKGSTNKITQTFRDLMMQAAHEVGDSEEVGKNGQGSVLAYLKVAAVKERKTFVMLMGRILPMKIDAELDFGQFWPGSSAARDSEHRIVFDDLMSAVEHEFHAAEISEGRPPALDV